MVLKVTTYDREVLEKFFRKGDASGKVSWGLVKPRGKKSLFFDLPGMMLAWKFKGGDDYEAMIAKIVGYHRRHIEGAVLYRLLYTSGI